MFNNKRKFILSLLCIPILNKLIAKTSFAASAIPVNGTPGSYRCGFVVGANGITPATAWRPLIADIPGYQWWTAGHVPTFANGFPSNLTMDVIIIGNHQALVGVPGITLL